MSVRWLPALLGLLLAAAPAAAFDHSAWDELLSRHVRDGLVDYSGMAAERSRLQAYLKELDAARGLESWAREERLAFWINAYNAIMVDAVLDHYPIRGRDASHPTASVLQIPGVFKKKQGRAAGAERSLDEIEHEILRVRFNEPRIHVGIVCASGSCPELRAEAFTAERLETQLAEQAQRFVRDERRNRIDLAERRVWLSRIFEWFGEDFDGEATPASRRAAPSRAGVLGFVGRHAEPQVAAALREGRWSVAFLPYDWTLNDTAAPPPHGN